MSPSTVSPGTIRGNEATVNETEISTFINTVFHRLEEGWVEVRGFNPDRGLERKFFALQQIKSESGMTRLVEWVQNHAGSHHVWVGPVLRRTRDKGNKKNLTYTCALWCDVDAKDFAGSSLEDQKKQAKNALSEFPLRPSLVVDSGYGYHAYWCLDEPIDLTEKSSRDRVEDILKGISSAVHGDDASAEVAHVMRLPGTPNPKPYAGAKVVSEDPEDWKPSSIQYVNENHIYELGEFDAFAYEDAGSVEDFDWTDIERRQEPKFQTTIHALTGDVYFDVMAKAWKRPDNFDGDRSAHAARIATRLFEIGFHTQHVIDAFLIFARREWDAADKYLQKLKESGPQTAWKWLVKDTILVAKGWYDDQKPDVPEGIEGLEAKLSAPERRFPALDADLEVEDEEYRAVAELEQIDVVRAHWIKDALKVHLDEATVDQKLQQARIPLRKPSSDDWKKVLGQQTPAHRILRTISDDYSALGYKFECPIPGHDGDVFASIKGLYEAENHRPFFSLKHISKDAPKRHFLPDVFASVILGREIDFGDRDEDEEGEGTGERRIWTYRMFHRCGIDGFETLPPLPQEARSLEPLLEEYDGKLEYLKRLYEGFCLLLRLRRFYDWEQIATPFSTRFARRWCQLPNPTKAGKLRTVLEENDYIHRHETFDDPRTANLFALGTASECECS